MVKRINIIFMTIAFLIMCVDGTPTRKAYASQFEKMIIDGKEYDQYTFVKRVVECTNSVVTIDQLTNKGSGIISFKYEGLVRTQKEYGDTLYIFTHNTSNELIKVSSNDGYTMDFLYSNGSIEGFIYGGVKYTYLIKDGVISGIYDSRGTLICEYFYDEKGTLINGVFHSSLGELIAKINPVRYMGYYYDDETGYYWVDNRGYYNPYEGLFFGVETRLDIEKLFGDKYEELTRKYSGRGFQKSKDSFGGTKSVDVYALSYQASQYYQNEISLYLDGYTSNDWYTNFTGNKMYHLMARIIYAENPYWFPTNNSDPNYSYMVTRNAYLMRNRYGVGWEIINRYYEDLYRYDHNYTKMFSSATIPTYYSILTYSGAFASLNHINAKGAKSASDEAYQEAFWIACAARVCDTFEEIDAVLYRPTGVTYQCYNKGNLNSNSSPYYKWEKVFFPGFSDDYTDASSYSGFTYYDYIYYFNILHAYKSQYENLFIKSVYYGGS